MRSASATTIEEKARYSGACAVLLERTAEVDAIVLAAFAEFQPEATLLAVGGYGRRELFPYSDVDILLLTDGPLTAAQREPVAHLVRTLWDRGLRVSQSVHTPEECCEIHDGNLELTISLLDRRMLAGSAARNEKLQALFPKFLNAQRETIATHLASMTRGRHAKYGNTIYHLEPNVKEHPGGLRDLHVIHWLKQLRSFDSDPLEEARGFLYDLRIWLHRDAGRDQNLLTFEAQDRMATDPANWMRRYYRYARQVDRAVELALELSEPVDRGLLTQFRNWRSRLSNADFTVSRERVLLRNPAQMENDPALATRLLLFMARHGVALARDTEERLRRAKLRFTWGDLSELLSLERCTNALRTVRDLGLMEQVFPDWANIDCLVVRDFYHRYTVDEHTLVALDSLEELHGLEQPHFPGLLSEIERLDLLRLAILLHDIGKGGGDHAQRSAEVAARTMAELGVPEADRETVLFLIRHHLDLSAMMTSRDLSEPATARQIAECTGTVERLKLLTMLTYADISAVNPSAMTPWRREQLWSAYRIGYQELTRELETEKIPAMAEAPAQIPRFVEGFPTRYLKTHTAQEIARHVELARAGIGIEVLRTNGSYRATVVAPDRPFLFASISGVLASFGMNILKAEAFTNRSGQILDTFVFDDPHRTLELNPDECDRLRDLLGRAVSGRIEVDSLMQKRRRPASKARVERSISWTNEMSETATLIEITTEDRPGLLYDLTHAISSSGANIEVVLIDTEAHRALDVFYVTARGGKLPENEMNALKNRLLEVA